MNTFLSRFAAKHTKLGVSRTWVLPVNENREKAQIAAYFSLTTNSVYKTEIPVKHSLPNYPVPVVLIARLAVDKQFQKLGLGGKTLVYALRKSVQLSELGLPAVGIVLDVLDNDALQFYQKFETFTPLTDNPMRLFMPMNVAKQI